MSLFERAIDYSNDVFRNIRALKKVQNLFDDLSDDPLNWDAANALDVYTDPLLINSSMIQRGFDYSKNDFIAYPFEHITASRYSEGSIACWYGSEAMETTIHETLYHFNQEILNAWDVFQAQNTVKIERRVAMVNCRGLAFDLSHQGKAFPWLVDPVNYTRCQETGRRVAQEGHPLLRVPSARQAEGVNLVVFNQNALSNAREYCQLHYVFDVKTSETTVYRGGERIIPL